MSSIDVNMQTKHQITMLHDANLLKSNLACNPATQH